MTFPATVRRSRVTCSAGPANLVVQSDLLGKLLLCNVSDRHGSFTHEGICYVKRERAYISYVSASQRKSPSL